MSNENPIIPRKLGVSYIRRQGLTEEILRESLDPRVGRFALTRALDGLDLRQLEDLLDELSDVSRPYDPRD